MKILHAAFFCAVFLFHGSLAFSEPVNQSSIPSASMPMPSMLRVAVGVDHYCSAGPRKNLGRYPLNAGIFETLTTFDHRYQLEPCLATSWEYLGGRTWRFHLRKGVKFHDETPFTAGSVKTALEMLDQGGASLLSFEKIAVTNAYTLELTTRDENLMTPYILANPFMGIERPSKKPVGTGPFRFKEYKRGRYLLVERNKAYWGEVSGTEGVVFRFIPDAVTRELAFTNGEVDVAVKLPKNRLDFLESCKDKRVLLSSPGTYVALLLSPKGLLKDPSLRKAVAMGIDKRRLAQALWSGIYSGSKTLLPPGLLGEAASMIKGVPFDPEAASRLLKGNRYSLTLLSGFPNASEHQEAAEIIQAQLGRIGFNIKIIKVNDPGLYHGMIKRGKGDLRLEKGSVNSADPTFVPHLLFHRDGFYSRTLHTVPASSNCMASMDKARRTEDMNLTKKYTALALRSLMEEEFLIIPLAILPEIFGVEKNIRCESLGPTLLTTQWHRFSLSE